MKKIKKSNTEILKTIKTLLPRFSVIKLEKDYHEMVVSYVSVNSSWNEISSCRLNMKENSFDELVKSFQEMNNNYIFIRETHIKSDTRPVVFGFNMEHFHKFKIGRITQFSGKFGFNLAFYNTAGSRIVEHFYIDLDRIESISPVLSYLEENYPEEEFTTEFRTAYEEYRLPSLAKMIKNKKSQEKTFLGFEKALNAEKDKEEILLAMFNNMSAVYREKIIKNVNSGYKNKECENYINELYFQEKKK